MNLEQLRQLQKVKEDNPLILMVRNLQITQLSNGYSLVRLHPEDVLKLENEYSKEFEEYKKRH
jgi:hypothetical protein